MYSRITEAANLLSVCTEGSRLLEREAEDEWCVYDCILSFMPLLTLLLVAMTRARRHLVSAFASLIGI